MTLTLTQVSKLPICKNGENSKCVYTFTIAANNPPSTTEEIVLDKEWPYVIYVVFGIQTSAADVL